MKVLVCFETWDGHAGKVAERIGAALKGAGHETDVRRCRDAGPAEVARADAVIVGSAVRIGKHHKKAVAFVRGNLGALASKPSAFFSVSLTARVLKPEHGKELDEMLDRFRAASGWSPALLARFAGALPYTRYGVLKRRMMKKIAGSGGNPTDTSRDHVFTDWEAVDRFAADFAALALLHARPIPG